MNLMRKLIILILISIFALSFVGAMYSEEDYKVACTQFTQLLEDLCNIDIECKKDLEVYKECLTNANKKMEDFEQKYGNKQVKQENEEPAFQLYDFCKGTNPKVHQIQSQSVRSYDSYKKDVKFHQESEQFWKEHSYNNILTISFILSFLTLLF